ncbi:MAG TPA: DUF1890 domain-containing protein [Methanolinea sp.]|nr:DUF1890 domain-containing protein [Methanolinea sp.]
MIAAGTEKKDALLVLGCPQVPVQSPVALYLMQRLRMLGISPVVAGNQAARMQVEVSDPLHHYSGEMVDLDTCIADLAEGRRSYSYYMIFVHNDAGVSYAATVQAITGKKVVAILYGEHFREVGETIGFPCEKVAAKAVHNPMPLKKKIDEVLPWVVSNL